MSARTSTGPDAERLRSAADESDARTVSKGALGPRPSADSEITWLLHRAAQRMNHATGEQAARHGLQLRDYIVLSALHKTPGLTQSEVGRTLGLDKTTLTSQLDRLERLGLMKRTYDPDDRRIRVPEITREGEALRRRVARGCAAVEAAAVTGHADAELNTFRTMLLDIIGDSADPGSCL